MSALTICIGDCDGKEEIGTVGGCGSKVCIDSSGGHGCAVSTGISGECGGMTGIKVSGCHNRESWSYRDQLRTRQWKGDCEQG